MTNYLRLFPLLRNFRRSTDAQWLTLFTLCGVAYYAIIRGFLVSPQLPIQLGTRILAHQWLPQTILGSMPSFFYAAILTSLAALLQMNRRQVLVSGIIVNFAWEILQTMFQRIGVADINDGYAGIMGGVVAYVCIEMSRLNRKDESVFPMMSHRKPVFAAKLYIAIFGALAGLACGPALKTTPLSLECKAYHAKKQQRENPRPTKANGSMIELLPVNPIVKGTKNYVGILRPGGALLVTDRGLGDRSSFRWTIPAQDAVDFTFEGDTVYLKRISTGLSKVTLESNGAIIVQNLNYKESEPKVPESQEPFGRLPPNCPAELYPPKTPPKPSQPMEPQLHSQ